MSSGESCCHSIKIVIDKDPCLCCTGYNRIDVPSILNAHPDVLEIHSVSLSKADYDAIIEYMKKHNRLDLLVIEDCAIWEEINGENSHYTWSKYFNDDGDFLNRNKHAKNSFRDNQLRRNTYIKKFIPEEGITYTSENSWELFNKRTENWDPIGIKK